MTSEKALGAIRQLELQLARVKEELRLIHSEIDRRTNQGGPAELEKVSHEIVDYESGGWRARNSPDCHSQLEVEKQSAERTIRRVEEQLANARLGVRALRSDIQAQLARIQQNHRHRATIVASLQDADRGIERGEQVLQGLQKQLLELVGMEENTP